MCESVRNINGKNTNESFGRFRSRVLLETSIDWDSFPTGETGGMSGPDEAGEDTKTEEVIVVPDPLIPDKIPTGTENLPTTDIPLTDHPTVDPPLTDNPAVDRPTTDDPAADRPTADENDGSISGDTEEDTDLGEGGSSDSGVQDGNTDGDASETPGDGTADGDTADGDTADGETADGGAENPAVPASPWVVDESGMLCKIDSWNCWKSTMAFYIFRRGFLQEYGKMRFPVFPEVFTRSWSHPH